MAFNFEPDPDFAEKLQWVDDFVTNEVEPLDFVIERPQDLEDPTRRALIPPLQERVRSAGMWGLHLGPELGGKGYGQVNLALLNEILGRSRCGPVVFGCQAPDTGNAEILASYGTDEQKARFMQPLLDGEMMSCFSMTEPQGGADPKVFTTSATLDRAEWVINGEKWFSSNAPFASFFIVMAVTDPEASPYRQASMFIVPKETPGITRLRDVGIAGQDAGAGVHSYLRFDDVRVPVDNLLGERGGAFVVAQTRLGGGRIHHCMRAIGLARRALDMMCERALSRHTQGERLADKQLVREMIADSWIDLESFRLLVLQTAWKIDKYNDYRVVRGDISGVKAAMPRVLHDIASRALQVHGSLGLSTEMPFMSMIAESFHMGLADGPTEVHKITLAREVLGNHESTDDMFPTRHLPRLQAAAVAKYASALSHADQPVS